MSRSGASLVAASLKGALVAAVETRLPHTKPGLREGDVFLETIANRPRPDEAVKLSENIKVQTDFAPGLESRRKPGPGRRRELWLAENRTAGMAPPPDLTRLDWGGRFLHLVLQSHGLCRRGLFHRWTKRLCGILVVDDDKKIASFVVKGIKQSGFAVDHCEVGGSGLFAGTQHSLCRGGVLICFRSSTGLSLVQQLRKENVAVPVIFTLKSERRRRVKGLQVAAKITCAIRLPFPCFGRVLALIRARHQTNEPTRLFVANLPWTCSRARSRVPGRRSVLQTRGFPCSVSHAQRGRVVTKTMSCAVWDFSFDPRPIRRCARSPAPRRVVKDFPRRDLHPERSGLWP